MKKIFVFLDKTYQTYLVLSDSDTVAPSEVLQKFITWHNEDFCKFDNSVEEVCIDNFEFLFSNLPIDFTEELRHDKVR